MISAPASVPQPMMAESTHQSWGRGVSTSVPLTICGTVKSPSNSLLAPKQTMMETMEVIQTRSVSGRSQLKSFFLP